MKVSTQWWRSAVVYQVYLRSFADADGDGIGDIAGLRAHLEHLRALHVDALWINPWYPSPMADGGYDVSDHRAVDPTYGTFAEATSLIAEAHAVGLRVLLDIVPNHTSDRHAWFQAALAGDPAARARYLFRPGRDDGPPNDWQSIFGGSAWTRVADGSWYLHLFDAAEPDLDWSNPEVRAEFTSILRFWFDLGVDGFRIDAAPGLAKADGLPDVGVDEHGEPRVPAQGSVQPFWDRDEVHDIYRSWRAVADSYPDAKVFVAEALVGSAERLVRYLRPGELHTAFNFAYVNVTWNADVLSTVIDESLAACAAAGAPATWTLSNHDIVRLVSRLGRPPVEDGHSLSTLPPIKTLDRALGIRRARAAALLTFALPGSTYVYQGDELGLWEVEDLPDEVRQDPVPQHEGVDDVGRDGCRVPLPWSGDAPPFGFSPAGATARPWLLQPGDFASVTVAAQEADPDSVLALYRTALRLRHDLAALGEGTLTWRSTEPGVLAFDRDPGFTCVVNLSDRTTALPAGSRLLLTSAPLTADGGLPVDAAAWLERPAAEARLLDEQPHRNHRGGADGFGTRTGPLRSLVQDS